MSEQEAKEPSDQDLSETAGEASVSASKGGIQKFSARYRWVWGVILVSLSLQVLVLGISKIPLSKTTVENPDVGEITLGEFHYQDKMPFQPGLRKADFTVHFSLGETPNPLVTKRLKDRHFKIKQEVEELLRRAHPEDFEDPELVGIKRQILEQTNAILEIKGVTEILVTDLELVRNPLQTPSSASQVENHIPQPTSEAPIAGN